MKFGAKNNHIFTFYYGEQHLLVKANDFLENGLKQNEKCFYCFDKTREEKILKEISQDDKKATQLVNFDMEKLINIYSKQGKQALKRELVRILNQAKDEGYQKIRILTWPLVAKEVLGNEDIIVWEEELDEILSSLNDILLLCPYNVNSLINSNKDKGEESFIRSALNAHTSLLSAEKTYKIENEFNITM